jgi:MFS family permease
MFPGSPYSPSHTVRRRLLYLATGVIIGASSTFANALSSVNIGQIAGSAGLDVAEASLLPAVYYAMNATANLTLIKARAQFGIPQVTGAALSVYAVAGLLQLAVPGLTSAIIVRATNGVAAASLITLSMYYLLQAFPPKFRPLGLVIGMGVPQLGTPLARTIPVDVLAQDGWHGMHLIEIGIALGILALVLAVRLPPSDRSRAFEPLDLVTIGLALGGYLLLCQVLNLGRLYWWTDAPWLGETLAFAILLLAAAAIVESSRTHPLVRLSWVGSWGIMRFAAVALFLRMTLAEQTFGSVGLLTAGGLTNDQLGHLFALVILAMIAGIAVAALTLSEERIPWQVMTASLLIALGAWLDSGSTSLTRPPELYVSQMLIGFGTTLFIGPALVYGIARMLARGGDYLISFVVLFSTTQNVGGLMGSALLGTLQTSWARNASQVLAGDMLASDPQVAGRLATGGAAFGSTIVDPSIRAVESGRLLGQAVARQAAVIGFNDTFRFVAFLALGTAGFLGLLLLNKALRERPSEAVSDA